MQPRIGIAQPDAPAPASIGFRAALAFWLKLGCISFGGPAGQIALMHQELVERRRWISERRFLHALNYCMLLPGPEAQQLATYIGWLLHRNLGGIVAGALFVLPSLCLLIALSWLYIAFGDNPLIAGMFYGIKPAVLAIVLLAAHRIGTRTLRNAWLWAIAGVAFIALSVLHAPFPAIVAGAALVGYLGGRFAPARFRLSHATRNSDARQAGPTALIDDDTPLPAHARFRWPRLLTVIATGLLLWCLPMVALNAAFGWAHVYTQMAWFFTKAALLTFGGAYAVLPYVYQGAVLQHGWLTPAQMIDGLALGESTPGPLIMVVAFVGFIGAYQQALITGGAPFQAGAFAAVLVTWFTFLPSFVFILAGAPWVEATRDELAFTAPLTAITAAVVGVILNLALYFGRHILWPNGFGDGVDLTSLGLAVLALLALSRFRQPVIPVLLLSALAGMLARYAGIG